MRARLSTELGRCQVCSQVGKLPESSASLCPALPPLSLHTHSPISLPFSPPPPFISLSSSSPPSLFICPSPLLHLPFTLSSFPLVFPLLVPLSLLFLLSSSPPHRLPPLSLSSLPLFSLLPSVLPSSFSHPSFLFSPSSSSFLPSRPLPSPLSMFSLIPPIIHPTSQTPEDNALFLFAVGCSTHSHIPVRLKHLPSPSSQKYLHHVTQNGLLLFFSHFLCRELSLWTAT